MSFNILKSYCQQKKKTNAIINNSKIETNSNYWRKLKIICSNQAHESRH